LSGPITAETSRYFNSLAAESDDAIVIVGRLGRDRFRAAFPRREVVYFDISEQNAKLSDLAPLLQHLLRYRHLRLVYPAFQNVVRQKPKLREVGSDVASKMASAKQPMPTVSRYLFEPTLPEVVRFFDTELFGLVLKQLFAELDLSLVGSRITSLESASTTIAREVKHLEHVRRLHKRRTRNRKQRERLSGRQLWAV
jgi:F0F1-type ATP synthase gamma subunit